MPCMSLLTLTIARHEILTPPFGDRLHRNDNSIVFRRDIYGPEVQTLVAGGSEKRCLHTSVVDLRGESRQIAVK